jgi:hypothetical protein
MARLKIAMLADQSQENQVQGGDELASDSRALQIEQTESEIGQMDTAIDEAQDASQAVQDVAENLEKQQEVSEGAVQVAQEMMGYLTKRTGIKFRSATAAMESYKTGDKSKKEQVIKELRMASESFNEQVSVAQEGVLDKIANKLSLIMTSNKSLSKDLDKVSQAYDAGTPREEALEDPAFASVLNPEDKDSLTAQDIVKFTADVEKRIRDPKIMDALNKVNAALAEAKNAKTNRFSIKDADLNFINKQIAGMTEVFDSLSGEGETARGKAKTSVEALDKSSKDALVKNVESMLAVDEIQDALKQIKKTGMGIMFKGKFAGGGGAAQEARQTAVRAAYSVYRLVGQLMKLRFEVAHASVKYIKASTGKGGAVQAATAQQVAE